MKNNGLIDLLHECEGHRKRFSIAGKNKTSQTNIEETIAVVPEIKKRLSTNISGQHYDEENPIVLSIPDEYHYSDDNPDDHQTLGIEMEYYVGPFEEYSEDNPTATLEPSREVEETVASPGPVSAENEQHVPKLPASEKENMRKKAVISKIKDQTKINTPEEDNRLKEEIKSIINQQKQYEDYQQQKKSAPNPRPDTTNKKIMDEPQPDENMKIFEKIAQSMQLATSYDLGSINLENRLDQLDKEIEDIPVKPENTPIETTPSKDAASIGKDKIPEQIENISIEEMNDDLKKVRNQNEKSAKGKDEKGKDEKSFTGSFSEEIPLSPASGGRIINQLSLENGDIILSTSKHPVKSSDIGKLTQSEISNASIYIGNGKIIKSSGPGIEEISLKNAIANDTVTVALRHKNMTREKAQVLRKYLKEKFLQKTKYDKIAIVNNLSIRILGAFCKELAPELSTKCQNFSGKIFLGVDDNNQFYCSELLFHALKMAGLHITGESPQWHTPEEIIKLSHNSTLQYVGHLKTP